MNNNKILGILGIGIIVGVGVLIYFYMKDDNTIKLDNNSIIESNISNNPISNKPSNPTSNKPSNPTSNKPIINSNSNPISNNPTSNKPGNGEKKTFTATFKSFTNDVVLSSESESCETYGDSCEITTPTFKREGYNSVGFSYERYQDKVTVGVNSKFKLTKDVTLYASSTVTRTATFDMTRCNEKAGIMEKKEIRRCTSPVDKLSCDIKIPKCTVIGTFDGFWTMVSNPVNNIYNAFENNSTISIGRDLDFVPYTGKFVPGEKANYKARNFSISKTFKIGNVLVEYEKGVPSKAVNEHINLMKVFYKNVPFLFKRNITIFVLTENTYSNYSIAYGLTQPVGNKKEKAYIDLRYDSGINGISDNATLHEMAHAWDSYYEYLGKGRISSQTNMKNLYNLLIKNKRLDHNSSEWFAGLLTEWYWHYKGYDKSKPSFVGYNETYSKSEKRCAEKLMNCYVNLANNNYKGTCSNLSC